jgi:maltose-binding protein MalE
MGSYWRTFALAFVATGLLVTHSTTAQAGCVGLSGTADGVNKQTAVARSQKSLEEAIAKYKASNGIGRTSVTPMRAKPQPYWRQSVDSHLYQKPDIITSRGHTICWRGVVSPNVCTTGAKVCW